MSDEGRFDEWTQRLEDLARETALVLTVRLERRSGCCALCRP